ncbi:hypothetical protein SAMN02745181_2279 [Rubritalea squalenifaciens DSM 18772]|uniref:Uncharacterized protein n=1 Tax=Rubritalea squalenifaciens DSM 18772 TaxID=1123071 RepID=A0A1M6L363_9BACT|nr:hypothetical protein [Rubritalea squalenifaciens]SHJ65636.1 hypothetical protein SAMN02745181_2279 [Rubritalea squalenifaciens DSM 18772]
MPQDTPSSTDPENDATLVHLVDAFIEDRLSEEEKCALEERLLNDEQAMDYCADRIGFHADMQQLLEPIRVEVIQKRHFVFERKHGLPRFVLRESQVTQVGNPSTGTTIEIPPQRVDSKDFKKRILIIGALTLTLILALVCYLVWNNQKNSASTTAPHLVLRNADFESTSLAEDEDAFSYMLIDWQDLFMTTRAGICDISRFSEGKITAPSGTNVAMLKPKSYLTQRLRMSDDTPLRVSPGLHIRVRGKVMAEDTSEPASLRLALRVVQSIIPEMVQYEPKHVMIPLEGQNWMNFEADFILPDDPEDMALTPSDVMVESKVGQEFNINGEPLTLSIDNRTKTTIFLDDLSIEILCDKTNH